MAECCCKVGGESRLSTQVESATVQLQGEVLGEAPTLKRKVIG